MFSPVIYHRTTMGLWKSEFEIPWPNYVFQSLVIILKPPSCTLQCRPLSTTTTALINLGVHAFRLFIMTYCRVKSPSLLINFIEFDKCTPPTLVLYDYCNLQLVITNLSRAVSFETGLWRRLYDKRNNLLPL